jgi:hypothetical protein
MVLVGDNGGGAYACERLKIGSLAAEIGIKHFAKLQHLEFHALKSLKEAEQNLQLLEGATELRSV